MTKRNPATPPGHAGRPLTTINGEKATRKAMTLVTTSDYERIKAAAARAGCPICTWIRRVLTKAAIPPSSLPPKEIL